MVGLSWRKCALHIHTPRSHDVEDDEYTVEELLNKIEEKNIDVIGITDHNNCEFIDEIIRELKNRDLKLHVFPGVEVTSNDGIHFLVYFDIKPEDMASDEWEISKTIKHVREFLSELGIHDSDYFNEETKAKYGVLNNFDEIKKIVEKFEGFIVFSHVKANENGLLRKGFSSDFVNDKIKELYIPFECKKDKINEILGVYPDRALILNTDYHHLEEYDSISPTYIKFGDNPSIKGLKQIMFDPSLRIRYEPIEILHPYIIKMILSSKYFGEMTITFNPYLNVIIGGRGSGKSVIIEIITYLLSKFLDLGDFHKYLDLNDKKFKSFFLLTMTPPSPRDNLLVRD